MGLAELLGGAGAVNHPTKGSLSYPLLQQSSCYLALSKATSYHLLTVSRRGMSGGHLVNMICRYMAQPLGIMSVHVCEASKCDGSAQLINITLSGSPSLLLIYYSRLSAIKMP